MNNLNCVDGEGITLNNGADLDFCGHRINCSGAYCVQKPAVNITAGGSHVHSSIDPATSVAGIDGVWLYGVKCNNQTTSRVDHLEFIGSDLAAYRCATVENNVFNGPNFAITAVGTANSDSINNNHIIVHSGNAAYAISVSGYNTDLSIDHNLIELNGTDDGYGGSTGINLTNSQNPLDVFDNIIIGNNAAGTIIAEPVPLLYSPTGIAENICEPEVTDCAACRTAGYCRPVLPGFVLP